MTSGVIGALKGNRGETVTNLVKRKTSQYDLAVTTAPFQKELPGFWRDQVFCGSRLEVKSEP